MGCTSSTEMVTDPVTGQTYAKHNMGGSYPGNRRTPHQPYSPEASEFNKQGQATAHFVSYGGGNALVLQQNGMVQPQVGAQLASSNKPQYIQVTLPAGVNGGDKIHVRAPDGRLNEIIVPEGFGPGSTFTVEFADTPAPTYATSTPAAPAPAPAPVPYSATATPAQINTNNNNADDGFATGFHNPGWRPTATVATATATTNYNEDEIDLSSYPTASDAKPVYNASPY
eukprot:Nitzschia sp. Nitz4//scaffold20_size174350//172047//172957//NITZ4_002135-RA/size174350-snap-gene-0.254-mRNA-1//-1//CDS//3329541908//4440//frame0